MPGIDVLKDTADCRPLPQRGLRPTWDHARSCTRNEWRRFSSSVRSGSGGRVTLQRIDRADDLGLSEDYDPADEAA